jgi:hypothetical protein
MAATLKSPASPLSATRFKDSIGSSLAQEVIAEEEPGDGGVAAIGENFDIYSTYQRILLDDQVCATYSGLLKLEL